MSFLNNIKRYVIIFFCIKLMIFLFIRPVISVEPEEFLKDPDQELRARDISKNIRCLVCQNQSIDDSSAELAKDLRIIIRKKINLGLSNKEIYSFLSERYGDYIFLKPPIKKNTIILWLLPFILLFLCIFLIYWNNKKSGNKEVR